MRNPTPKPAYILYNLVQDAIKENSGMIGDLTKRDAEFAVDFLREHGFKAWFEAETFAGKIVESDDWKIVRFEKAGK